LFLGNQSKNDKMLRDNKRNRGEWKRSRGWRNKGGSEKNEGMKGGVKAILCVKSGIP